jgi:hypothetical protein
MTASSEVGELPVGKGDDVTLVEPVGLSAAAMSAVAGAVDASMADATRTA